MKYSEIYSYKEGRSKFTFRKEPLGYRKVMCGTGRMGVTWTEEEIEDNLARGFWYLDKAASVAQFIQENL